jgi:hypothetical protein
VGEARYSAICRELNFASESVDDIPNRGALKLLLARVEAEAAQKGGNGAQGSPTIGIGDARGQLLQAARKSAERDRQAPHR